MLIDVPHRLLWRPTMIVAAHPDDETLGLGALVSRFHQLRAIVHVSDGAPRRGSDVMNAGVNSWQEYARLRRSEFAVAMQRAGVSSARLICLNYPDQETSYHLPALTRRVLSLFERFRPAVVFTHSYEGGHPDHDTCAAAVRFACLLTHFKTQPEIFEFAGYHAGPYGDLETECFLGRSQRIWQRRLTEQERQMKRGLVSSYPSQQRVLCQFPLCSEPIRSAPLYDFRKPPHPGKLYYENFDWGITGRVWRKVAARTIASLRLSQRL